MDSVFFNFPLLLIGFVASFVFGFPSFGGKGKGVLFPLLSLLLFAVSLVFSLLYGADLLECLVIACVFFIENVISFSGRGRNT